ncbi:glycosyltransferase family 39 protein [Pseudomonas sp. T1.Ur]|uniref:glycosyltransferase family 39 protein n=1 Tax=Pseudomonas sp. T1.Ur TaxID=2928704 RepID=UPI00201D61DB|nr:glycosyltransferase family 39 protein [Pseudomonas sp. T1.Ur]MCL6703574.1 glycosyltransferase family 39 protein [Pseudomonas sp. T1.Ur]
MKFDLRAEHVRVYLSLSAAILFGAYLRLRNITEHSLWLDELFSVAVSQPENSFFDVFHQTLSDVHPPFFQWVLWVFYKIFGFGEMVGRYLSAAFGIMLIPAVFALGRQIFDLRVGLYVAWFAAVNFYLIVYSQEIRSYELLALLTIVSFVVFIKAMRTLDGFHVFVYSLTAAMLVSTHYFGFLVVFAQALLVLIGMLESPWDKRRLYHFSLAGFFILLCVAPQIPYMYARLDHGDFWVPVPNDHFFIELFILYFGSLPLSIVSMVLLVVAVAKCLETVKDFRCCIFVVWIVTCMVVPYLYSLYVQPVLTMRNLIILLPVILVLLAFALSLFKERWARIGLGVLILCFSMTPIFTSFKPVHTFENQLTPVSQMRDVVAGLIQIPTQWPMYAKQNVEFGMYFKLLGSSLTVRGHDQFMRDLLSKELPEKFYYLATQGIALPEENFMRQYGVVLMKTKTVGNTVVLELQSLYQINSSLTSTVLTPNARSPTSAKPWEAASAMVCDLACELGGSRCHMALGLQQIDRILVKRALGRAGPVCESIAHEYGT